MTIFPICKFFRKCWTDGQRRIRNINPNSPNSTNTNDNEGVKLPLISKVVSTPESSFIPLGVPKMEAHEEWEKGGVLKKKGGLKLKIKVGNPSLRRLISGAIAVAVSRTCVAPLETIRIHLMVGTCANGGNTYYNR
ncbi:hypothetical protein LXL04_036290 [Taraxacum kok-saghyz]